MHGLKPGRAWLTLACALVLACAATLARARPAEAVPLYVGYSDPPYSTDAPDSASVQLAARLSALSNGRYLFRAQQLPRRRLNLLIAKANWKGVVAWANPAWFRDESMTRYAWSQPYATDSNLVVSRREQPVEFTDHGASLEGLRLGCIAGQRYPDLEELLHAHRLVCEDVYSDLQNLLKLKNGHIDVAFVQASSMTYFRRSMPDMDSWLYVARNSRGSFKRYLFSDRDNAALADFIAGASRQLAGESGW